MDLVVLKMEEKTCSGCNAKCCRYVATEIDTPEDMGDYENILWYLCHKDIEVFINDDLWYIQFNTDCKNLDKNGKCLIYDKRPEICKNLKIDNCERYGEGEPHEVLFKEPEEFVRYMKEKGVEIRDF